MCLKKKVTQSRVSHFVMQLIIWRVGANMTWIAGLGPIPAKNHKRLAAVVWRILGELCLKVFNISKITQ